MVQQSNIFILKIMSILDYIGCYVTFTLVFYKNSSIKNVILLLSKLCIFSQHDVLATTMFWYGTNGPSTWKPKMLRKHENLLF